MDNDSLLVEMTTRETCNFSHIIEIVATSAENEACNMQKWVEMSNEIGISAQ